MEQPHNDIFIPDPSARVGVKNEVQRETGIFNRMVFCGLLGISVAIAVKGDDVLEYIDRNIIREKVTRTLTIPDISSEKAVLTGAHIVGGAVSNFDRSIENITIEFDTGGDPEVIFYKYMCFRDDLDPHTANFCWETGLAYNNILN